MDLLIVRLEYPGATTIDDAKNPIALHGGATEPHHERPCLVKDRLDREVSGPVDETGLAVHHDNSQAIGQAARMLELRLGQPALVGARQAPQLVLLHPADRWIVVVERGGRARRFDLLPGAIDHAGEASRNENGNRHAAGRRELAAKLREIVGAILAAKLTHIRHAKAIRRDRLDESEFRLHHHLAVAIDQA
jgi:hypothetical protein